MAATASDAGSIRRVTPGIRSVSPAHRPDQPPQPERQHPDPRAGRQPGDDGERGGRDEERRQDAEEPQPERQRGHAARDPERVTRVMAHEARAVRRQPADETAGHPRPAPGHGCRRPRRQPQQGLGVGLSGRRRQDLLQGFAAAPGLAAGRTRSGGGCTIVISISRRTVGASLMRALASTWSM